MLALLMLQKAMGCRLHDPCNIILMQKQLEKCFDNWDWTIIPEEPDIFRLSSIECWLAQFHQLHNHCDHHMAHKASVGSSAGVRAGFASVLFT